MANSGEGATGCFNEGKCFCHTTELSTGMCALILIKINKNTEHSHALNSMSQSRDTWILLVYIHIFSWGYNSMGSHINKLS